MGCEQRGGMVVCSRDSRCRGCGARIKWVKTLPGKNMPVNKETVTITPDKKGVVVAVMPDGKVVRGNLTMRGVPGVVTGYISHFATCPVADKLRRDEDET
jgi:hypothetical protein